MGSWVLPVQGVYPEVPEVTACAKEDVKKALTVLNNHLLHYTYMVGHTITLADISVCCALVDGMKTVLGEDFRKPFGNVMRWFNLCLARPEFAAVLGQVKLCGAAPKGAAAAAPKKETAPNKEAQPKKEAEPKKEAKGKKGDDKGKKDDDKKDEKVAEPSAEDAAKARKDKLKKVIKEGGK